MSKKKEQERLVKKLVKELNSGTLAVFAGAGLSMPAGYVNWRELLRPIAEEIELSIEKETDLVTLAQYYYNQKQANRGAINQALIDEFSKEAEITENHKILARLPIDTYWTTNYDKLIEGALSQAGKIPDVKYDVKQLVYTKPKRDAVIYKMHGDVDHPGDAVIIKDDYESYHVKMQPFLSALGGDLISKTFLFIGLSFSDPNLDYILSRVRVSWSRNQRPHYSIMRKVKREEGESLADFEYRERKQELFVQDLLRFGITTTLVEEYCEITDILSEVERKYKQKSVFISGAASEFGSFGKDEAESFVYELSRSLVNNGSKIISGFGLGIGSAVITGALESIYSKKGGVIHDQLILRPFPQSQVGSEDLRELWRSYREDMLSYAGVAIFIFGNKKEKGEVFLSGGMREEYEIAKTKGAVLLPVGATGYMAKELWDEVVADSSINSFFSDDIKEKFAILGDEEKSLDDIRATLLEIVDEIRG
ncbi:SIR2 family protein [Halomonas saccharevitans]|uniref:NAD(+) hydrolase ThsA n=1 Tax=Halomonas saccharevitans TaxID=416872 RepID=A0ABU3NCJ0_9GAMM|nr:SIR2 family protein [Halomonas saccharevitans]MDT8878896.1 SIR2 family protein [Halomonas saccharevitans]